jgi:hypothetical protein
MALIRKAGGESDLDQGIVGRCEFLTSEFDPQFADVFARGTAEVSAEFAREMDRVDADCRRNFVKAYVLGKPIMEQLAGPRVPSPRRSLGDVEAIP